MASKIYSIVAVVGLAVIGGGAYWYQNKPASGPKEMTGAGVSGAPGASGTAGAPAGGASAPRGGGLAGVEVAKVEVTRLQDDGQAVGSLRSKQNVMLRPEVSGRIQTLGFTDGGRVRRGDLVVQLEDTLQRAEVRQAEAQMSIARANLRRNQELVAQNFVAQRVVEESQAQLQVQEAQLSLACARWERMRIVAPFDGTVGIRNVNLGDYVKDGADLVNLEDLSSMYVDFRMPERFIGKLRREQAVELQLDAMPGRLFKAKIEAIDPQLDANGRSVNIRAVLPNTGGEPMAQRPGGPGGPGGSGGQGGPGASGGAGGAGVQGGRPNAAGAGSGGANTATKPAAKPPVPTARPAQRPASAPVAGSAPPARPVDQTAVACAQFSNSPAIRAAAGSGAGGGAAGGQGGQAAGAGGRPGGAGGAGGAPSGVAGGAAGGTRPAMSAPTVPTAPSALSAQAGGQGGGRPQAAGAGGRGGPGGPGAGMGAGGPGGGPLRPGMFARVTAVFNIKDSALTVPEEAIVPQGGRQFVIRLIEQTEAEGKAIAEKQAEAARAAAAAAAASAPAGNTATSAASSSPSAGGGGGGPGGAGGGAPPYNMSGFVDGKRLVSQRVEVKIGIRRPGRVEITEGLNETDTVVIAGQQRLQRDNSPVRIIELGRPPGGPGSPGGPQGVPGSASALSPSPSASAPSAMSAPASAPSR